MSQQREDARLILADCLLAAERQLRATQTTSATSSDETNLSASARVATDARALADVLVVATTERVIHRLQAYACLTVKHFLMHKSSLIQTKLLL